MQTGHMPEDDPNKQQAVQAKRFTYPQTNGPINTTNHSGRSSRSSEINYGLRHEGAFETVRGSGAPKVVISMEGFVSRFTGNTSKTDMAWTNHDMDESISEAMVFAQAPSRSNNNDSSDLHTSSASGNTSGRPTLAGSSSRLSLGGSLANITRRLSSIGTGRSKRSSMASKRSSIDTNQDSVREEAGEGEPAHGMNLADFGARASRRTFSMPGIASEHNHLQASTSHSAHSASDPSQTSNHSIELQDIRPTNYKPGRRHLSASQKEGKKISKLIVGFQGSGHFSSSGEGSMRGLDRLKGSKSSGGVSDLDRDLHESGHDSWQSLGSLDSLGLPVQQEKGERQPRRRSSLISVGETAPTRFEEADNDEAIKQLRRSSMDHDEANNNTCVGKQLRRTSMDHPLK